MPVNSINGAMSVYKAPKTQNQKQNQQQKQLKAVKETGRNKSLFDGIKDVRAKQKG